jgi:predicted O-methyltransferase YrrM
MRVNDFIVGLPEQYDNWNTPQCSPKDPMFAREIKGVWGMIVPNKMAMIRYAASLLEPDEIYLEAGVLQGMSMICATKDNDVHAVGVDNWSQFPTSQGNDVLTKKNLIEAGVADRVILIEDNIHRVLLTRVFPKVGVYYYDANHDFFETLAGLEEILPHLAKDALIIVDDSAWPSPSEAIHRFDSRYSQTTHEHGEVEILFEMKGDNYEGVWTTGMAALRYRGIG